MTEPTSWVARYGEMLGDPAHWAFEITVSIVFDLLIIYFGYQILVKRVIIPRLRREIHAEIDRDHDLTHDDHNEWMASVRAEALAEHYDREYDREVNSS